MRSKELGPGSPKSNHSTVAETTVLMPIGGRATRAQDITRDAIPKHLIRLNNGDTVLDTVCRNLQQVGFRDFVFCLGHHKDQMIDHLSKEAWISDENVTYAFAEETKPLGVDGAILNAIGQLGLEGKGMIIPGDSMLPWENIASMARRHDQWGSDVTVGVTSHITDQTTDVGKIIVEDATERVIWCYGRTEATPGKLSGCTGLTSAGATGLTMAGYSDLCETYLASRTSGQDQTLSFRDHVLPWSALNNTFAIHAYDIQGEVLDLGTPDNLRYGQEHWQEYV
jgi:NDP-sugar pyrophosphorylase family protein